MQLNILVDTIMATTLAGGVSFLYYGERIVQFPLALIGTALGIVLLPTLSKEIHSKPEKALKTQNNALLVALVLILPASTALFIMAENIIMTLFERGAFTAFNTGEVMKILQVYAFGLPMFVLVKIFVPSFFARKDTKTPMQIACVCLLINVTLNLLFIRPYGYVGIAMATVISSFFNVFLLVTILLKRNLFRFDIYFLNNFIKVIYSCVIMAVVIVFTNTKFIHLINLPNAELNKIVSLLTLITIGAISYFAVIYLTKLNILKFLRK
jgi:putative peptidoglycan lipid II flippase